MSHRHYMLYKPDGYLSQLVNNSKRRRNKRLVSELYDFSAGTMCIGRLDEPSEGLLLLTTDGRLSHYINSSGIEKEYVAQVDGIISAETIKKLQQGVSITHEGKPYRALASRVVHLEAVPDFPPRAKKIRDERHGPTSWVSITLTEGKFRQVRKMTSAVGFPTLRLVRIRVGSIYLENLKPGEVLLIENLPQLVGFV